MLKVTLNVRKHCYPWHNLLIKEGYNTHGLYTTGSLKPGLEPFAVLDHSYEQATQDKPGQSESSGKII